MAGSDGGQEQFFRVVSAVIAAKSRIGRTVNSGFPSSGQDMIPAIAAVIEGALPCISNPGQRHLVMMLFIHMKKIFRLANGREIGK